MSTETSVDTTPRPRRLTTRLKTACLWILLAGWTLPAVVHAQFNFTVDNGTVTITGYTGADPSVTIPDTINGLSVTSVGDGAFYRAIDVTEVTIPNTVTNIGGGAFYGCDFLSRVTIPNTVTNIGGNAFNGCIRLPGITIPEGVPSIGSATFASCISLTNITIPQSVTSIGGEAFEFCSSLSSVRIPNGVTDIGGQAFLGCGNLAGVYFTGNAPRISGPSPFPFDTNTTVYYVPGTTGWGSTLAGVPALPWDPPLQAQFSYTITNSAVTITGCTGSGALAIPAVILGLPVTRIGNSAFQFSANLANVTIPDSVTNIGDNAFASCASLTSLTLGASVARIGNNAFAACTNLTGIFFKGNPLSVGSDVCLDDPATIFYLPGTKGWGATFSGRPAVPWNPQAPTGSAGFGVRTNEFGFTVIGASNIEFVVEGSTNLASRTWYALQTNELSGDSSYFSDPQWMNYPCRFYRLSGLPQWELPSGAVFGYLNLPLVEGFNLIANPLDADGTGTNNTIAGVFGARLPIGSVVYAFDGTNYQIAQYATNLKAKTTGWSGAGGYSLNPGQGAWVYIPPGAFGGPGNIQNVTLVGQVLQGNLSNPYVPSAGGFALVASMVPLSGGVATDLGCTPQIGDTVYAWDPTGATYNIATYTRPHGTGVYEWFPGFEEPVVAIGEAFWMDFMPGSAWSINFSVGL